MSITDLPGVFLPCILLSSFLLTLSLTLRLLKILRSLYLHNDFHLSPLSISKPTSPPSFLPLLKTFLPLYGSFAYHRPQFDIPQSGHLMLSIGHLTILWAANVSFGMLEENFDAGNGVVAGVVASCVAVGVTYVFYTRYLQSFNSVEYPDLSSQSRTEAIQHSPNRNNDLTTFIDTSTVQKRQRVQRNEADWRQAVSMLSIEPTLLVYISAIIGLNFWSIGMHYSYSPGTLGSGLILQWLFGAGIDIIIRLLLCGTMAVLRIGPRIEERFWKVELGISVKDLGKYSKRPRESGHGESGKDTFFHDQMSITPPPTTPRPLRHSSSILDNPPSLPPLTHHSLISQECCINLSCMLDQVIEDNSQYEDLKLSPGKAESRRESPQRGVDLEEEGGSDGMSQDTMPEVPHNMYSPAETPRGYSGFHFYRTPEHPLMLSPERSPAKPSIPPKSPTFELHLQPIAISSESEPESPHKLPPQYPPSSDSSEISDESSSSATEDEAEILPRTGSDLCSKLPEESDELYMVEFLPGGIMTRGELLGSQYDVERRKTEERAGMSLYQVRSEECRTRSVERDLPVLTTENMARREPNQWLKSPPKKIFPNAPAEPSLQSLHTEENRPATDTPFRDISNLAVSSQSKPPHPTPDSLSDLLQASLIDAEYERLTGMLAAHEQFRRRRFKPVAGGREAKSVTPYRGWRLGQRLVDEPIGAISKADGLSSEMSLQQATTLQALSEIYIQPRPLPGHTRSRSQQKAPRDQSRLRTQSRL